VALSNTIDNITRESKALKSFRARIRELSALSPVQRVVLLKKGFKISLVKELLKFEDRIRPMLLADLSTFSLEELDKYQKKLLLLIEKLELVSTIQELTYQTDIVYLAPILKQAEYFDQTNNPGYLEELRTFESDIDFGIKELINSGKELGTTMIPKIYPDEVILKLKLGRLEGIKSKFSKIGTMVFDSANKFMNLGNEILEDVPDLWLRIKELEKYLYLNLLFIECLRVSAVSNRQELLQTRFLQ
jgi:hypothetical protein